MKAHHLKVTTTGPTGWSGKVALDGADISSALSGLEMRLGVEGFTTATLELVAPTCEVDGEFQVHLPEETQALLKRLGWTPPEETP